MLLIMLHTLIDLVILAICAGMRSLKLKLEQVQRGLKKS